jgi:hypothetical protein
MAADLESEPAQQAPLAPRGAIDNIEAEFARVVRALQAIAGRSSDQPSLLPPAAGSGSGVERAA